MTQDSKQNPSPDLPPMAQLIMSDLTARFQDAAAHSGVFRYAVGTYDKIHRLLEAGRLNPNAKDCFGRTLLMKLADTTDPRIVPLLLEHGADPLAKDCYGRTALMHAVWWGTEATVLRLIPVSDIWARSDDGFDICRGVFDSANTKLLGQLMTSLGSQEETAQRVRDFVAPIEAEWYIQGHTTLDRNLKTGKPLHFRK